ncbi:MAG: hypothetical protein ABWZ66_06930 [Pyrinomonadaceae bacterium]
MEAAKDCGCPAILVIESIDAPVNLCPKCLKGKGATRAVVLPSLDSMPEQLKYFHGKVYAGFNPDLV